VHRNLLSTEGTTGHSRGWGRGSLLLAFLLCAALGMAQLDTANISGNVTDQSGGAAPGAAVTVRNVGTGVTRTLETNAAGRYEALALPVGSYEVDATLAGFQRAIRSGITLTVGRNAVVDFVLQVGEVTQAITVSGEASQVETTTATVTQLVDERKVLEIPLNNRDLTQLAFFDSVVLRAPAAARGERNASGGMGDHLSVAGSRAFMSKYLLDGVSNEDLSNNAQSATTGYSGAETVKEFQVITNNYSAEYPSVAGAIVSAVTKSGTNSFHGSVFEFLRNDNMDAAKWEANARGGGIKPEFRRNQFGGSLGGPIFRDKTFFFGSYEGLRESIGETPTITLPTAAGRRGELGGDLGGPTEVNPKMVPWLNLLPVPGQGQITLARDLGNGLAEASGPQNLITDGDYGAVKVDHQFADQRKGFLAFTFNVDDSKRRTSAIFPGIGSAVGEESKKWVVSARHTSILNATTLNEFVFGFNKSKPSGSLPQDEPDWTNFNGVDLRFASSRERMGQISFGDGVASVGFPRDRSLYARDYFTFKENLSLSRTNHTLKFGAEFNPMSYDMDQVGGSYNGVYQFQTFRRFLQGDVEQLEHDLPSGVPLAGGMTVDAVKVFYLEQTKFGFYAQDNWKVRPSLTLNLGLRYEFLTNAEEKNGKFSNLRNITDPVPTIGLYFRNPTTRNFSPRFGFAWSPGGAGQTAVRGGFGVFYSMPDLVYYRLVTQEMVPYNVAGFLNKSDAIRLGYPRGVDFPNGVETQTNALASVPSYRTMEYDQRSTHIYRWNLSLERQMGSWFGSLAYNGSKGVHLLAQGDANMAKWIGYPATVSPGLNEKQWAPGPGGGRIAEAINPGFGNIWVNAPRSWSLYNGLSVSVQRRMARGLQFQASYNFSKNMDNSCGSSNAEERLPQNQRIDLYWDWGRNAGLSCLMLKHNFVTNFTWALPSTGLTGIAGTILNGWQTNGVLTLTSGTPFSIYDSNRAQQEAMRRVGRHRPNLITNGDNNPITDNPDRYFDVDQFIPSVCRAGVYCYTPDSRGRPVAAPDLGYQVGFLGNLGSNTLIGPRMATFDFSLNKDFSVTETMRVQFRSEFFNIFNTANFMIPSRTTLFSNTGARDRRAGLIEQTRTSPRQNQFGLKFIF